MLSEQLGGFAIHWKLVISSVFTLWPLQVTKYSPATPFCEEREREREQNVEHSFTL